MLTKKHRVITVVISLKRPRIQMIDFQSKDKTAYVDLLSPSQEMRFFEGLFNETQVSEAKRTETCWSNYPRSAAT
jgi:hypothetical protein